MSREYDNRNRGAIFRNDKEGGNPNWPDYRGSINVDGKDFWLDAWIKESKKDGKKYMSLSIKPKLSSDKGSVPTGGRNDPRPQQDDLDDDVPF